MGNPQFAKFPSAKPKQFCKKGRAFRCNSSCQKLSQRLLWGFHCNPYCEKRDTKKFTFILSFRRNLNKLREKVNLDSFGMTNFAEILKHQFLRQIMQQLCVNNFCANCRFFPMSAMSAIQNVSFNICFIRKCF